MTDNAGLFRKMADNIDHNKGAPFGGAIVIVPPDGGGKPVSTLLLDDAGDPAQFWAALQARAQIEIANLSDKQRQQQAFNHPSIIRR